MTLPPDVEAVCTTWLGEIDALAHGLVTGLHLRGGVGFGEFVPGRSDVDFVAILSRRPGARDEDALETAHAATLDARPETPFDGIHVLAEDLAGDPDDCPDVLCVLHGHVEPEARYDVSPVAWHELALHSVPVRGVLPPVWTDQERLLAFTRTCIESEWRPQAEALAKFPAEAATEETCTWVVLGLARLQHLLVTGEMASKSAAGRWGLAALRPRWHPVLQEALRIREGTGAPAYADPADRGLDVSAFARELTTM